MTPEEMDATTRDLLENGTYVQQARTLLIEPEGEGKQIVLILGDTYTMWPAATFRQWATRLLHQLP